MFTISNAGYPGPKGPGPIEAPPSRWPVVPSWPIRDQKVPAPLKRADLPEVAPHAKDYPGPKGPGPIEARRLSVA